IDKTICSKIRLEMANSDIEDITFFVNPDGDIFPDKDLPVESRKLKGFVWRGDERILTKDDIFDEDDNNIELVKIRGIDNPVDIDTEEQERQKNSENTIQQAPNSQAVKPKKTTVKKVQHS
ncbi:MAG: OstA-like protein, partial [Allomuricauda sp.]